MNQPPLFKNENNYPGVWNDPDYDPNVYDDEDEIFIEFGDEENMIEEGDEMSNEIGGEGIAFMLDDLLLMHGLGSLIKIILMSGDKSDLDRRFIPRAAMVKAIQAYRCRRTAFIPGNRQGVWIRFKRAPSPLPSYRPRSSRAVTLANTFSVSKGFENQLKRVAPKFSISNHPFFIKPPVFGPKRI